MWISKPSIIPADRNHQEERATNLRNRRVVMHDVKMSDVNAPENFSWGKLIVDMKLKGLPALIACHTEPVQYDANGPSLVLQVNKNLQELHDSPAFTRLAEALKDHFGASLDLQITFGPATKSPASIAFDKRVGRYTQAYTAIAEDDLVARLIEEFGGKVIVESVKPVRRTNP